MSTVAFNSQKISTGVGFEHLDNAEIWGWLFDHHDEDEQLISLENGINQEKETLFFDFDPNNWNINDTQMNSAFHFLDK